MSVQINYIDCPQEWESADDYDSHRPLLYMAATKMQHPVIEFGCGYGSTPLLRELCKKNHGLFVSLETDEEWASEFPGTVLIDNYKNFDSEVRISLLFIDGKPGEERKDLLIKFKDIALVTVVHDTEIGAEYVYGMGSALNSFKYRVDYQPEGKPHTSAVSDFINIEEWF